MLLNNIVRLAAENNDIMQGLGFTTDTLRDTLLCSAVGLGGIFAAMVIIYIFILLLQKLFPAKKAEKAG